MFASSTGVWALWGEIYSPLFPHNSCSVEMFNNWPLVEEPPQSRCTWVRTINPHRSSGPNVCLLCGELNPFTFKVISIRKDFCHFVICFLYTFYLFCLSFSPLLPSLVLNWFFSSERFWFPSHFLLCVFVKCFFMVTMGITFNILNL